MLLGTADIELLRLAGWCKNLPSDIYRRFGAQVFHPQILRQMEGLCGRDEVKSGDMAALTAYLWNTPDEIEKVKTTITEICENPLGERIGEIHSMASEAFGCFQNGSNGSGGRAIIKLRGEFIALYGQIEALRQETQSDRDRDALQKLLDDLEGMSSQAHNTSGFTYATLKELSTLQ